MKRRVALATSARFPMGIGDTAQLIQTLSEVNIIADIVEWTNAAFLHLASENSQSNFTLTVNFFEIIPI